MQSSLLAVALASLTIVGAPVSAGDTPRPDVKAGVDVMAAGGFAQLKGRKVGLVTNHTGRAADGATTIDLLFKAEGVKLVALFSPEHGIRGELDEKVGDTVDAKTGLPVYSLYGERRKPTAEPGVILACIQDRLPVALHQHSQYPGRTPPPGRRPRPPKPDRRGGNRGTSSGRRPGVVCRIPRATAPAWDDGGGTGRPVQQGTRPQG